MKVPVPFSRKQYVQGVLPVVVTLLASVPAHKAKAGEQGTSHKPHHSHHHGKQHEKHHAVGHAHEASAQHKRAMAHKAAAAAAAAGAAKAAQSAQPSVPENIGTETKLPLPRYASMRADRVYMRRGPGERYPIDWVYHRRGYPVMIEREFGVWRLVEDPEGQKGWVHQVTLHGSRSFIIPGSVSYDGDASKVSTTGHADSRIVAYMPAGEVARGQNHDVPLMSSDKPDRTIVALLEPGAIGKIKACPQGSSWCHVTVRGYDGWIERRLLWGVQPGEIIQPD
ncbi:SH3 domain-containing protein [Bombella intestini]|nr:SH3 domain-containing protein [Bombella intestini]